MVFNKVGEITSREERRVRRERSLVYNIPWGIWNFEVNHVIFNLIYSVQHTSWTHMIWLITQSSMLGCKWSGYIVTAIRLYKDYRALSKSSCLIGPLYCKDGRKEILFPRNWIHKSLRQRENQRRLGRKSSPKQNLLLWPVLANLPTLDSVNWTNISRDVLNWQ